MAPKLEMTDLFFISLQYSIYAPVKLFCPHPPNPPEGPPGQPLGQRKMCVIKKSGALEKRVIIVFIQGEARQKCSDEETGATKTKFGGMGAEQFDRRIKDRESFISIYSQPLIFQSLSKSCNRKKLLQQKSYKIQPLFVFNVATLILLR